ncbi:hypothetical protein LIER_10289 [Lithospermum erythrorhizon]|uniref:F-box domain-containing protein n=1 Tax=Lithospermum erythrorhizon TaxID=34254 RepID=A0AAV3PIV8_LITER
MNNHNTTPPPSITAVHHDIIESHILKRLDGQTLASTSCVSSEFNTLCNKENLWKNICNIYFPSTLDLLLHNKISSHRTFFSSASSAVHHLNPTSSQPNSPKIKKLISAVDISFEDKIICSRVIVTDSSSSWFSCSPCRIDILEPKEVVPTSVKLSIDEGECMKHLEKSMKVSWILLDPDTNIALNVCSKNPVLVKRHWLTGEFQVKYATVVPDCRRFRGGGGGLVQCGVVVTCRMNEEREMHVKEVSMIMEDLEGLILDGSQGLEVLQQVLMNGKRKKIDAIDEKERYEIFVRLKTDFFDEKQRREQRLDMMCIFTSVSIFLMFWTLVLFR